MITTVGKEAVKKALPKAYQHYADRPIDGKQIAVLMTELAEKHPDLYIDTVQKLNDIGRIAAYRQGREASISLRDLTVPSTVNRKKKELKEAIYRIVNDPSLDQDTKLDRIMKITHRNSKNSVEQVYTELLKRNNAMARQIESGSRGNKNQLMQVVYGDLLMDNAKGETIPYPGLDSYGSGVSPLPYWLGAQAARKGAIATQFATADSGYFSKQMANVAHRMIVTTEDCGTKNGLTVEGDARDNVGAVLLEDAGPLKAGTVIQADHLPLLAGKHIKVRSPLACNAPEGVCQKCAGIREKGDFPDIGDAVGINAVRSFAEGVTQASLGSKHGGGAGTGVKPVGLTGFKEINQFVQVPKNFIGGAIVATLDGKVAKVQKAPQGGTYVIVNGEQFHIPKELTPMVKVGDRIDAGDVLSSGLPNPAEIVKYKGIGEGRKYFLDTFGDMLKRNGAGTNRRNLELFARSFISKVRVNKPEGFDGHMIGDVVDYDAIAARWEPRKDAKLKSVTSASNLYLEKPVLHYSIGTRITPQVSKTLRANGVTAIMTHAQPPPFEPFVTRAQDFMQHDKDWITRMGGENLKRATLDAAARGSISETGSTSYYPGLVNIGQ